MKFGVREIANCVFKAKSSMKIGSSTFRAGQPVLYIDTAKTSSLEGAATTVYAQGGRGNTRLIAWEGEKTLTFTVEDALLSPIGFAILSGAGLFHPNDNSEVHAHTTANAFVDSAGKIDLTDSLGMTEQIDKSAPIFVIPTEPDGSITGTMLTDLVVTSDGKTLTGATNNKNQNVFVDFYINKAAKNVNELQIDAEHFGGYFYVEADTLFRDQASGKDLPATLTLPNVKIQSNFTFSMASSGDPSTFTFTMDAMPGYTYFDKSHKVLCVIQIINEAVDDSKDLDSVMKHSTEKDKTINTDDSGEALDKTTANPGADKQYIDSTGTANAVSQASYYNMPDNGPTLS